MSVLIKLCGFTRAEQVAAAVEAGANAIGFVFAKSIREIEPEHAARLAADIPAHIRRVAVMHHPEDAFLQNVLASFAPDVLQTDAADFMSLTVPDSIERWPVYREGNEETPPSGAGCYIYEGQKSGQGQTVDWSKAAKLAAGSDMIIAGGLSASNVAEAISVVRPFGVDVSSAVESLPGVKDQYLISEFVAAVRAAEKDL